MSVENISEFPPEILWYIPDVASMSVRDILNFCASNKQLYQIICQDRHLWTALARQRLTEYNDILDQLTIQQIQRDLYLLETNLDGVAEFEESNGLKLPVAYYFGWRGYELISNVIEKRHTLTSYLRGATYGDRGRIYQMYYNPETKQTQLDVAIRYLIWEAIYANNPELVRTLVEYQKNKGSFSNRNLLTYLDRAVAVGNKDILDILLEQPDVGDEQINYAFRRIGLKPEPIQNVVEGSQINLPDITFYNLPDFPSNEFIHRLLPFVDADSIRTVADRIIYGPYKKEHVELLKILLERDRENILRYLISALEDNSVDYLPIILEYVNPDMITEAISHISSVEALKLFDSYIDTDKADTLLFKQPYFVNNYLPIIGSRASPEGLFDAWINAIFEFAEGQYAWKDLEAFFPYLTEDQINIGRRLFRKKYGYELDEKITREAAEEPGDQDT